jgi:hypothetical protein
MLYFTIFGQADLFDYLRQLPEFQPKKSGSAAGEGQATTALSQIIEYETPLEVKESYGYALDYETLQSMVVWVRDNKDVVVVGLATLAFVKDLVKKGKGTEVKVVVRNPLGTETEVVVKSEDSPETVEDSFKKLLQQD